MPKNPSPEIVDMDNAIAVINVNYVDSLEGTGVDKWNAFIHAWHKLKKELEKQND